MLCVAAAAIFLVSSCSLDLFESQSSTPVTQTVAVSSGSYIKVNSNTTTLRLTGLSSNNVYLMKYNPTDNAINASNTGYVSGTDSVSSESQRTVNTASATAGVAAGIPSGVFSVGPDTVVRYDNPEATAFNANPLPLRKNAGRSAAVTEKSKSTIGDSSHAVGATESFWIQNSDDSWTQTSATLRAVGTYCYVWVCNDNYDDSSTSGTDDKITTAQAEAAAAKFDTIYPPETAVFGAKYDEDNVYTNLVSPSDKISILVYDIDGDYSASQTGGTFGFFWSKDLYTDSYLQTTPYDFRSNETELFYVDAHFLDAYAGGIYSTLAHEFQHMLEFVHKNIENSVSPSTWYNEMMSMVCEDMMQSYLNISDDDSPKSRFRYFNYYYPYGMTYWRSGTDVLISYANAYAFGAYLARNYGGAELIHEIASNHSVDMDSITAALQAQGYSETCTSVFLKEGQALVYTDSDWRKTIRRSTNRSRIPSAVMNLYSLLLTLRTTA
jgi:hypothetical protein